MMIVECAMPSRSASTTPTCAKPWSSDWSPVRTRSTCSPLMAEACGGEAFDLILTGLQSDDQGYAQTGVVLAARLGLPHATIIMDVKVDGSRLRVKRELEGGWFQWVGMPLPAVLTIQSGINQLR